MKHVHGRMDESILVCVYYGPNGERLINRGIKLSKMLDCPLYILTVDRNAEEDFDTDKQNYMERWKTICDASDRVEQFIVKDAEERPIQQVIAEVCNQQNITQVIIGQTAQSRWQEITKGSFINLLLRALPFVDLHIVSVERFVREESDDELYEKGIRAYLIQDDAQYKLCYECPKKFVIEGLFFKELGTDFDNGLFKFMYQGVTHKVTVFESYVLHSEEIPTMREKSYSDQPK